MTANRALGDLKWACVVGLVQALIGEGVEVQGGTGIGLHGRWTGIEDDLVWLISFRALVEGIRAPFHGLGVIYGMAWAILC